MPYTGRSIPNHSPIFPPPPPSLLCFFPSPLLSLPFLSSRSKYQSRKLPVILRESPDKRGKLERWMRVSWQIHDVNTFVSPPKWAAVSSLPNKCQPNKTSWLHTNAITGRIPAADGRRGKAWPAKTHCLSTGPLFPFQHRAKLIALPPSFSSRRSTRSATAATSLRDNRSSPTIELNPKLGFHHLHRVRKITSPS